MKMHTPSHKQVESTVEEVENEFVGLWRNQHGSELKIEELTDGKISGHFKTGENSDAEYELTGFVSGHLISFCVNFGKHKSLTAWTGRYSESQGRGKIDTLWHLSRFLPEKFSKDAWSGIFVGADTFERIRSQEDRDILFVEPRACHPSYPFEI